jgi:hypothetical protein
MMHKYLIAAAALVLSPLALACDECHEHQSTNVSYEKEPVVVHQVPARYEVTQPRFVTVERDYEYYADREQRYNYTKPAAGYRLWREESFDDDCD